jgi:hypothetical protein
MVRSPGAETMAAFATLTAGLGVRRPDQSKAGPAGLATMPAMAVSFAGMQLKPVRTTSVKSIAAVTGAVRPLVATE